jgi:ATP-dependent Lon protease
MKESAQAALSYARNRSDALNAAPDFHETLDFHIHVPAGAIPKDGPSAGVTMATAIISALTGVAVKRSVAMTGEVTLRGKVLPVGGLKEKALAAHRARIQTVLVPDKNVKDLSEIPENIRRRIQFVPVSHMDQVLEVALESPIMDLKDSTSTTGTEGTAERPAH